MLAAIDAESGSKVSKEASPLTVGSFNSCLSPLAMFLKDKFLLLERLKNRGVLEMNRFERLALQLKPETHVEPETKFQLSRREW